ncbi:enoyl-CoA hydratase/isomerase family protein [Bacillus thermotolerans]|uniref:Enoyl-CoA hydratase n=1 Tax=Bacillus thermotolerans TaxID=1221996 RepID=A0A0F5HMC1_BACTR|nr:enoyl-CoA hydratase/isomerase family protein [Bacillus thermotolerans]KKB34175.1 Enoyl-CoA hydratase [Bacillus thermotolerans]KKB37298.1 Enoyl-CoA hydratase [Bacillus thermotolerans]KKB39060.1 Enoyl-CoA hydratase [Bacillus thermotolerans]
MGYENILTETKGELGVITINRPSVRNALNDRTINEMAHAFNMFEQDEYVRIIVFTATGGKAFAAGADINEVNRYTPMTALSYGMANLYKKIESCRKVTIAAINGIALGGGFELALSCDIRLASEKAVFGLPELNLGVIPAAGGTQRLTRLIGKGRTLNYMLTGDLFSASEAKEIGLVTDVIPPEQLWSAVEGKAQRILTKGPLAVQLAKLSVQNGGETDIQTGLLIEQLSQAVLYSSEDKREGTSAFLEKRRAAFVGQ